MADRAPRRDFVGLALYLVGNRVAVLVLAFGSSVVLARALGPSGRGDLAALLVFPMLFVSLSELGVRQAAAFHLGRRTYGDEVVVANTLFLLGGASLLSVAACAGVYLWLDNPRFTLPLVALALGVIPLRLGVGYAEGILLGKGAIESFAGIKSRTELLSFGAVVLFVAVAGWGLMGAAAATFLVGAAAAAYALRLVSRYAPLRPRFDPAVSRDLVVLGAVYALTLFTLQLNYRADVVLLERLRPPEDLGQYAVGVAVVEMLWQIPAALSAALFSRSATAPDPRAFSLRIGHLLRVALVMALGAGVVLYWVAGSVIPLVYGPGFAPSVEVLRMLIPGVIALTVVKVLYTDLAGKGRPGVALVVLLPSVVLNVALNLAWIPERGAVGAALASSFSYSVAAVGLLLSYTMVVRVPVTELLRFRRNDFAFLQRLRVLVGQ